MAEMPNVVSGETITSEWGNMIRSRSAQRYASVTERTALHPLPEAGDLAYMEDTGKLYVYHGGAWVMLLLDPLVTANIADGAVTTDKILDGAVTAPKLAAGAVGGSGLAPSAVAGSVHTDTAVTASLVSLTGSFQSLASITLNLTTLGWSGAKVAALGIGRFLPSNELSGTIESRIAIGTSNGTTAPAAAGGTGTEPVVGAAHDASVASGSHTIAFQARQTGSGTWNHRTSTLIVIAVRTS